MRPASLRSQSSPFVRRKEKTGSKKLELDWDRIEESYNHTLNNDLNYQSLQHLRKDLVWAEERGRTSAAKKIRRQINLLLEEGLALQATWCGTCHQVLHQCQCPSLDEVLETPREELNIRQLATEILARRMREAQGLPELTHSERRRLRRETKANR